MSQLNQAYLLALFQAVVTGTEAGSYAIVPADAEETKALVNAKYIKLSKKLHNEDGNVGATLVAGATEADLRVDFEIPDFPAAPSVPEVEQQQAPAAPFTLEPEAAHAAEAAPAPVAEAEAAPAAPVAPTAPAAPFQQEAAPEFNPMTNQVATEAPQSQENDTATLGAAPVEEHDGLKIIGDTEFQVATVVQTRKGEVEIDVGVPFVTKVSSAEKKEKAKGLEHHPFGDIAAFKIQNPASAPSFHIAGRAVKDISNSVRRANDKYEKEGSPVTFRAVPADENDPKGKGVRVFALFVHEAPAQRRSSKKDEAAQGEGQE